MKLKNYLLFLFLFFVLSKTTEASHVVGADLTYQCTNTSGVYKITLKIYRDCVGINFCNGCAAAVPNGNTSGCNTGNAGFNTPITGAEGSCLGVSFGNYTLDIKSSGEGFDIVQTCSSVKTVCTNCNTRTAGTYAPGIEVYTFEGNVNLNNIPSSCCKIALGISNCCRNGAITNFVQGNFYTECIINRCITPCNSGPFFTNEAAALTCAGSSFVYNIGAVDPDGDSLSYAFGASLQNPGSPVTYNAPYNAGYPFDYLGAPNANAAYPAGLRIDPVSGDILFSPVGQWVSNLVIDITQWKKIGNTYVNVGITKRDLQFQTMLCNNLSPKIKIYKNGIIQSGKTFTTDANQQICLDIVAEDQENLASPPAIVADTTDLAWSNPGQYVPVMANATWTRNYILNQRSILGPKADSFKFCWTPPISAIRQQPYLFTVSGVDRYCPLPAKFITGINIKVNIPDTAGFDSTNRKVFCASKAVPVIMSYKVGKDSISAGNVFTAQLSDSSGSFASPVTVGSKAGNALTGVINVVIPAGLSTSGNYKLRLLLSSDSGIITRVFPISIVTGLQPAITSNRDSVCAGNNILLTVLPNNNGYTFKWLFNNTIIAAANNDSLLMDTSGSVKAIVSNAGCTDTSLAKTITVFPNPVTGNITGNISVSNPGVATPYAITAQSNITYNWGIDNGSIQSGQGSSTVSVMWSHTGIGKVWVVIADSNSCHDSTLLQVNIGNVGLQNINLQQALHIYPNPGKSTITVTSQSNKLAGKKYIISNTIGQTMLSGKLNAEETSINIENLNSGVYLLRVEGISNQSIKIIKE